jgi:molybdopterin adenylyltransferase
VKIAVITSSDRASKGIYADLSGPAIVEVLKSALPGSVIEYDLVPDDVSAMLAAFSRHPDADWILTTGGTGPAPRDVTPEATLAYCDREMPGIADYLRVESLKETPNAVFSRGVAGLRGTQYVVNFPGSEKAARFCAGLLAPLMAHGTAMAKGEGHEPHHTSLA